jgi:hypothetical protein
MGNEHDLLFFGMTYRDLTLLVDRVVGVREGQGQRV